MATLRAVSGALRLDAFDELQVTGVSSATSNRIEVDYGPVASTVLLGNFTFGPLGVTGTVNRVTQTAEDGSETFTLTGGSADAAQIFQFVNEGKLDLAVQVLLSGNDSVVGGGNDDLLFGYLGRDTINGGGGDDVLVGGFEADRLTGGAGADTFVFQSTFDSGPSAAARDVITDFSRQQGDKIDLWQVDAVAGNEQNDEFTSIVERFTGGSGELRVQQAANGFIVSSDVNADRRADFSFLVVTDTPLIASDFIL